MKNKLGYMVREAKKKATTNGIDFALGIAFLALNNIIEDYVAEDKRGQFFKDTEAEVNRIYQATIDSVPSGEIDEMAEKIVFHVQRFREKWGMDDG